jgi:hypothetical protein
MFFTLGELEWGVKEILFSITGECIEVVQDLAAQQ